MIVNDKVFKALADKNRRKIIALLKNKELNAGEIAEQFDISKPSISEHLKVLKNANLIGSEKQGQYVNYFLNASIFEEVMASLMNIFGKDSKEKSDE